MLELFTPYRFDSGKKGPLVLITAGVHGDEYEPMLAARKLTRNMPGMLKSGRVIVVPVVNKSAFKRGSRYGKDGLDLARTCPGNVHGSVTEKVAARISKLIQEVDFYIDLHTGGAMFTIFPLAGYMLHEVPAVLEQQQNMARAFDLPLLWSTDRFAEGRTLSVARDANIPAIYVEYGGGNQVSGHITETYYSGCLGVLGYLNMLSTPTPAQTEPRYWLEDHRLNGGHLQSKMPAPEEGIFSSLVEPGQLLKKGNLWGTIIDPVTGNENSVTAETDGMVLFARVSGKVDRGDSLGGIFPVSEPGKIVVHAT